MKNKPYKWEIALEILEILEKEGIDVSAISPRRTFKGEKRCILLKEVRDERIDDLIKKYNFDPNFNLGAQIRDLRKKLETYPEVDQKRILKLGIKKHEIPLDQQKRAFRNQIEEALYILEELKEEGVDTALIPQSTNGKLTQLRDIDSPKTKAIIKKLGLKEEYLIGSKMRTISWEYTGKKHDYHFGDKERKRVEALGFLNDTRTNIEQTLLMLEQLAELGIDVSSANKEIELKDGTTRRRYICEIEDENIDVALEKLQIPKYTLIGQRIEQAQRISSDRVDDEEFKNDVRARLQKLGIMREEIDINKTLEVLRYLEEAGVHTASIPGTTGKERRKTTISDISLDNMEEFLEQLGIQSDFPLGKGINKVSAIYRNNTYKDREDLTEEEKRQIEKFGIEREQEKEKTVVKETISLIKRLGTYGIDINAVSLRPMKDGQQTSLTLADLPLTPEQLEEITEEFEIDEDFPLGNRIINIRQAYKGKNRVAIDDDEKKEIEELGIVGEGKIITTINAKRIRLFQILKEAGVDVGGFTCWYKENGKQKTTNLGMLGLEPDVMERIAEEFGFDESFLIGNWKIGLKNAYRDEKLTPEQKDKVEDLGIISELDKLDMEQKALEMKLKEIEELKAKAKAANKNKNPKNVGELHE